MSKEVVLKKMKFLLGAEEDSLPFLKNLKKEELDELFIQTANAVNGGQTELWQRLAKSSHILPGFLAAKLSENIFGEVICANVASYMKVKDALKVVNHLSIDFMARTCPHMIPEKTEELINAIPLKKNRKVTRILLGEEDYYTIARFVDTLEFSKVMTIAKEDIKDERVLLRISTFVENKELVGKIFMAFSDKQKINLLQSAYQNDYQDELEKILAHLSKEGINHIRSIIGQLPEAIRSQMEDSLNDI
ncbi:MAG: hypothetical protein GY751_09010 [Bacteroidetes bacterium]|nr:hypothetical protein [Bacteroidota bacterium]